MADCAGCGGRSAKPTYGGLMTCRECAHVWAEVEISDERLRALYARHYFFGEEYSNYLADESATRRNFRNRLRTLERFLQPSHQRLYEVGCAYGLFLDEARARFPEVAGIDISDDAVAYARRTFGLDVVCGDLLQQPARPEADVVCLWDTIEHLSKPDRYIERIASMTRQGGVLALTTGDIGSLNARLRKERWRLIHPPTHLHYFTVSSLTRLLDRFGFDVLLVEHCGNSRSLGSITDGILRMRWGWPRAAARLRDSRLGRLPVYLNLFDIMHVVARKR